MSDRPWDGVERRKMTEDWIERDRMLTEVHSDVKHIAKWTLDHEAEDSRRFDLVNKEIEIGKKVLWGGVGVLAAIEFIMKLVK